MAADLLVEEIFRRVVDAGSSINSYEVTIVRVTDKARRKSEVRARQIRVGNDYYRRWEQAIRPRERLDYKGREYLRDSADEPWTRPEESGSVSGEIILGDTPPGWDEGLYSPNFALDFNRFRNAEHLPDEVFEGRTTIRIAATEASTIPALDADEIIRRLPATNAESDRSLREALSDQLARRPERMHLTHTFWIDAKTFALLKVGLQGTSHRGSEVVESFVETQVYSRFNEAELPGPLPD